MTDLPIEISSAKRNTAERAHALIRRDPALFTAAFAEMRAAVVEGWKGAPLQEQREEAWHMMAAINSLEAILKSNAELYDAILATQDHTS